MQKSSSVPHIGLCTLPHHGISGLEIGLWCNIFRHYATHTPFHTYLLHSQSSEPPSLLKVCCFCHCWGHGCLIWCTRQPGFQIDESTTFRGVHVVIACLHVVRKYGCQLMLNWSCMLSLRASQDQKFPRSICNPLICSSSTVATIWLLISSSLEYLRDMSVQCTTLKRLWWFMELDICSLWHLFLSSNACS